MANFVTLCSPSYDPMDSYGLLATELYSGLRRRRVEVTTFSLGTDAPNKNAVLHTSGGILLGYPTNFHFFGGLANFPPKIAVTMFESTRLPERWADILNDCRVVIVPSAWCAQVFRDNGVKTAIQEIPLGVSKAFRYVPRDQRTRPFTFLAIADRGRRKGWDVASQAFVKAFGNREDVHLILKCRTGALPGVRIANPNITLLQSDLSRRSLSELYAQTDCMLWPSRGEGFGLPPREYAKTGGMVISTAWSGMADEHLEEWAIPLSYHLVDAWDGTGPHSGLGQWADPDLDHLIELMRQAVDGRLTWDGQRVSERVDQLYRWSTFTQTALALWQDIHHAHAH